VGHARLRSGGCPRAGQPLRPPAANGSARREESAVELDAAAGVHGAKIRNKPTKMSNFSLFFDAAAAAADRRPADPKVWHLAPAFQQENGHAAMHLADANNRYGLLWSSAGPRRAWSAMGVAWKPGKKRKEAAKMKKWRSRKSGEWNSRAAACRRWNNFFLLLFFQF
jgi:hypothetical protein